ncbi:DUF559 domain-containing protein [Jatrophihabitans sp. GAS493]|uniref:DUF559 domain-containing protein n=1 Tax=Jatrophihabitans sp. GAS493 TaxID=1907575 RepID=UPI0012FD5A23|nr:DUF559 domain-containing protein [Jatrophihabitans sp. GAS493]
MPAPLYPPRTNQRFASHPTTWAALARRQGGVISRRQLIRYDVSSSGIGRLRDGGQLVPILAGVFLVRGAPVTLAAKLWAAAIATDGVVGFTSAAHLWGFIEAEPAQIHVLIAHARRVYPPEWVRVHRTRTPIVGQTTRRHLPITSRPTSLLDHLTTLPRSAAVKLADRGLQQGWITPEHVLTRLQRQPRHRGNATLRHIAQLMGDRAAAESERRLHRLLRDAGITGWRANHPVYWRGRRIGIVDVALLSSQVAIEMDGMAYHVDVDRFRNDRRRQNDLIATGWRVLRFTWADLTERPEYVVATIRQFL